MKKRINIILKIILAVLAAIPVINFLFGDIESSGYTLIIFSIFVFIWLVKPILNPLVKKINLPLFVKFVIIGFLVGLITEFFVFFDQTGLFSENLVHNLILSLGIYNSLSIIWYFLLKKYKFSLFGVFLTAGIFGIFFEGLFAIFLTFNPVKYLYIVLIYGSIASIPYSVLGKDFDKFKRKESKWKYLVAFLSLWITYVIGSLWIVLLKIIFGW